MAQTYVQEGKTLRYTNAGETTIASGSMVKVGVRLGIAVTDIAAGATGDLVMQGVHALPKGAVAVTMGAALYLDDDGSPVGGASGDGCLTTTAEGNLLIGYAAAPAADTDATVDIALNTLNA
ncbi:DUF2190 family protein [Pseudodesulfovibrio pelocollis]|uniref:DUF2190 family protein n=1 Tax=Pseudodesulfovibrio pelocollis TaxID=3051432 RepID=UPI00255A7EB3|nr:DUF2190 family protein [Pseudodesulfovibrio sp. SB368]